MLAVLQKHVDVFVTAEFRIFGLSLSSFFETNFLCVLRSSLILISRHCIIPPFMAGTLGRVKDLTFHKRREFLSYLT